LSDIKSDHVISFDKTPKKSNWDPSFRYLYIDPGYSNGSIWSGKIILESLKLKDGKAHKFILRHISNDKSIVGKSLTTNRERSINFSSIVKICFNNNSFDSIPELISHELVKREYFKFLISFSYSNKFLEISGRFIGLQKIYFKFDKFYLLGVDSKRGEQRTFLLDRMEKLLINDQKVDKNILSILNYIYGEDENELDLDGYVL
jgi:hypothetical protein